MHEVAPSEGTLAIQGHIKHLEAGCHVLGSFGEYQPNPNPNFEKRVHKIIFGHYASKLQKACSSGGFSSGIGECNRFCKPR
jgi:hypothetical protein